MNLHRYEKYHSLTLEEIARITGPNYKGYAVFLLPTNDPTDVLGEIVDEGFTVAEIINHHPELAKWIVKYTNDYHGEIVLRAAEPAEG